MNRNSDKDLSLREAFPPMPEECHSALMNAARSVKEETPVKKTSLRAVLIAAAIIVLTMAVALAADQLGMINLIEKLFPKTLPESAKTLIAGSENKTFTAGPIQFSLGELLADGRVVVVSTQARVADDSPAVLVASSGDSSDRIPESEAKRLKLPAETSLLEAAKQAKVPLYMISSYLTIDFALHNGEEMMAEQYAEDGSLLLIDMLQTKPEALRETLEGTLTLKAQEINPETGELVPGKEWQLEEVVTIPVGKVIAEKTYQPEGEAKLDGYTVKSLKAEQTVAGIYLTTEAEAGPDARKEDVLQVLYQWDYQTAAGKAFPSGINMSGWVKEDQWPIVTLHQMIGADQLPETMQLTGADESLVITLK